jgi:hypothetical protein
VKPEPDPELVIREGGNNQGQNNQAKQMGSNMRHWMILALLSVGVVAGAMPIVGARDEFRLGGSFVVAQRFCPNGRC